jgi:hypothetical protein
VLCTESNTSKSRSRNTIQNIELKLLLYGYRWTLTLYDSNHPVERKLFEEYLNGKSTHRFSEAKPQDNEEKTGGYRVSTGRVLLGPRQISVLFEDLRKSTCSVSVLLLKNITTRNLQYQIER